LDTYLPPGSAGSADGAGLIHPPSAGGGGLIKHGSPVSGSGGPGRPSGPSSFDGPSGHGGLGGFGPGGGGVYAGGKFEQKYNY